MSEAAKTDASEAEKNPRSRSGRDSRGKFLPGVTGNNKGRPPSTPERKEVHALCVLERPANVARLVQLRDHCKDEEVVLEAIKIMLSYSDGKPVTAHLGGPLVNVNLGIGLSGALPGQAMSPEQAYAMMCQGILEPDPHHPAFAAVIEHQLDALAEPQ